jgi:hypothetical protein
MESRVARLRKHWCRVSSARTMRLLEASTTSCLWTFIFRAVHPGHMLFFTESYSPSDGCVKDCMTSTPVDS